MAIARAWNWLRSRFAPQVDPVAERWAWWYAEQLQRQIAEQKSDFSLAKAVAALQIPPAFVDHATDRAYRLFLKRAWSDLHVSESERKTLRWVASVLQIGGVTAREIDEFTAREVFGRVLERGMEDGTIDAREKAMLTAIAANVEMSLAEFTIHYLKNDGRVILEALAASARSGAGVDASEWQNLVSIIAALGLSEPRFLGAIAQQAEKLVDDIVRRIAANGEITSDERHRVESLIDRLQLGPDLVQRIEDATKRLTVVETLTNPHINEVAAALNRLRGKAVVDASFQFSVSQWERCVEALRITQWHEEVAMEFTNRKYSAGANTIRSIRPVHMSQSLPKGLRVNSPFCNLAIESGSACFLPTGVAMVRDGQCMAVRYADLVTSVAQTVSEDLHAVDAVTVGNTWKYVNLDGGPDARFRHNPTIPIYSTSRIEFPSVGLVLSATSPNIAANLRSLGAG